ncbi:HNH endonuclease [Lentzea sp. NBRC 105346]|uniref:HNH endonuclease signature motif containing protein n=1 Tax=Lentzea sp. NBRC 105346 TaxID=3032205 RepID=UPI0024A5EF2F|nr:HNH endonuclease signature motif containing protein [Lentzea sp. NBRC 105346]GLZ31767.1 HNH endonuclease [Lentzea sp. NBRC 105346]
MSDQRLALLSNDELLRRFVAMEREDRVRAELKLRMIGEMDRRGLAAELGHKDLVQVFKHLVQWDTKFSQAKVASARRLTAQVGPSGAEISPELPATAEAMAEGRLTEEHVAAVAEVMKDLPEDASAEQTAEVERLVVDFGRDYEPRITRKLGKRLVYGMFQNDEEPVDKEPEPPVNKVVLRDERGRLRFWGDVDPVIGAMFRAALDPLAKPHPTGPEGPDPRGLVERQGDAFAELINLVLRAGRLPEHGGETVTMAVTVSYDDLVNKTRRAVLDNQQHIPAEDVRKLACDAGIIPIVLGGESQPLNIGRKTRALNAGIRRAIVARDHGCAFPGCDRPPRHCEGHHVRHWADGGETSSDNCVLLCRRHHDLIHHSDWEVKITNGIPYFYPPAFLDPLRRPKRNPLHMAS